MTTTLDDKCRAVLKSFQPGDVLKIEPQGADAVLLRRVKSTEKKYKPRLVRQDGRLVIVDGKPITNDDERRMIEEEP